MPPDNRRGRAVDSSPARWENAQPRLGKGRAANRMRPGRRISCREACAKNAKNATCGFMPEIGQMLYRACPICDRADAERLWEKGTLLIQRCRGCSMLYANPVPEEIASDAFYQQRGHYLLPEKLQSDYAPVRYERELKLFRAFCKGGAVLDVGCSTGAFLYQLETRYPRVYEVIGTDVPGAALDFAKTRGIAVTGEPFLNWDLSKPRFDAVTFWAVMEHLIEPKKFIQKAVQALKPGGHCFVLVPNAQSLAVRLLGMRY